MTLAPVPPTDDEVRLLLIALERLRDAQPAVQEAGGIVPVEVPSRELADITALHRHLAAEAEHRRNCHQGRQSRLVRAAAKPTGSKSSMGGSRNE